MWSLLFRYSARNVVARRTRTALTALVIALVVLATTLFLGLVSSLERTLVTTGDARNLIVLSRGAQNDASGALTAEMLQTVLFVDGVARNDAGEPLVSPELVRLPYLHREDGRKETVLVRGVEPIALEVHDEVRIDAGRMFRPSVGEAIVGRSAAERYAHSGVGGALQFGRRSWAVVGVFESGGSSFESEVWVGVGDLAADSRRDFFPYSGLRLRAAEGVDPEDLARRIGEDRRFALDARRESDYYEEEARAGRAFYAVVVGLALLAGIAGIFGTVNTVDAAVQARTVEIGTLRALGFAQQTILATFLLESVLIALLGCAVGTALALGSGLALSRVLGGVAFPAATLTTHIVQIRVGFFDVLVALVLSLLIGLVGGYFPASRAARLRPVDALRKG